CASSKQSRLRLLRSALTREGRSWQTQHRFFVSPVSGGYSGRVTPDPIPNSEVKPASADGTARETVWESRTSPDYCCPHLSRGGGFFFVPCAVRRLSVRCPLSSALCPAPCRCRGGQVADERPTR